MRYHQVQIQTLKNDHRTKANNFLRKAAKNLKQPGRDENLANICSFYAAYHAMRYAILDDPVFQQTNSQIVAQTKNRFLNQDTKFNTHHSARQNSENGPGQNEIISLLYPSWYRKYEELHKVSIDARYLDYSGQILISATEAYQYAFDIVTDALAHKITYPS